VKHQCSIGLFVFFFYVKNIVCRKRNLVVLKFLLRPKCHICDIHELYFFNFFFKSILNKLSLKKQFKKLREMKLKTKLEFADVMKKRKGGRREREISEWNCNAYCIVHEAQLKLGGKRKVP